MRIAVEMLLRLQLPRVNTGYSHGGDVFVMSLHLRATFSRPALKISMDFQSIETRTLTGYKLELYIYVVHKT